MISINRHLSIYKIEFFILTLFCIIGYVPFLPYFIANIILLLVPLLLIFNAMFLKVSISYRLLAFIFFSLIIGLIPFIFTTDISLISFNPIAIVLRSFGPILVYLIIINSKLSYHYVSKIFLTIYFFNFIIVLLQFFIFDSVKLQHVGSSIEWVNQGNTNLLFKRVTGLLGNANALGAFSLIMVILLENYFRNKKALKKVILITAFLTIFFFSKSRNVMITSVMIYIFWLIFHKFFLKALIIIFTSFFLIYIIIYFKDSDLINAVFRINLLNSADNTVDVRRIVNTQAIHIWKNNFFIFGGGLSTEANYMSKFFALKNFTEMLYIKLLMEGGIIGFFSYFFVLFYIYFKKIKTKAIKNTSRLFYLAIIIISFAETVFYNQQLYFFTFLVLGALTLVDKKEREGSI